MTDIDTVRPPVAVRAFAVLWIAVLFLMSIISVSDWFMMIYVTLLELAAGAAVFARYGWARWPLLVAVAVEATGSIIDSAGNGRLAPFIAGLYLFALASAGMLFTPSARQWFQLPPWPAASTIDYQSGRPQTLRSIVLRTSAVFSLIYLIALLISGAGPGAGMWLTSGWVILVAEVWSKFWRQKATS